MARDNEPSGGDGDGLNTPSRRAVLRGVTGAGVGLAGLTALTGSASGVESLIEALSCTVGWESAPAGYPTIDTFGGGLTTSNVPTGEDEVVFFCHGYGEDREIGLDNAYTFDVAAQRNGYDKPVVGILWDAVDLNWYNAKDTVEAAARRFADWLRGYAAANPGTTINLAGHSMGGRFVTQTLNTLDGDVVVDDAILLGAAIDNDDVCSDGRWAPGIEASAERVSNFHSWDDEVVGRVYATAEATYAAGHTGADDGWFDPEPPDNYVDHDRTFTVDKHCDYHKPDHGVMPAVADVLQG